MAVAENGVIGNDNGLPWRLSSDLKRFKAVTWGKPVVMGRKTYLSIGQPLPGRTLIVVTRDASFRADGVEVAHSLDDAIDRAEKAARAANAGEIMIAGGAEIYAQTLGDADRLYLTTVHDKPEGDAAFPEWDKSEWQLIHAEKLRASERDSAPTTYEVYDRL
nr:Dihydrofolate reductase [uncultured bacterium]AIA11625.1 Dihydrofolate reductase [uncultured bacterium]